MPTTLELVLAEHVAQDEEEARPPYCTVDRIRSDLKSRPRSSHESASLEMCVLTIQESDRNWKLELVDLALVDKFELLARAFAGLDAVRRNQFVFQLSIWKSNNRSDNVIDYREGFCYRFEKVRAMKLFYEAPVGSIQLRSPLHARPMAHAMIQARLDEQRDGEQRTESATNSTSTAMSVAPATTLAFATASASDVSLAQPAQPCQSFDAHLSPAVNKSNPTDLITQKKGSPSKSDDQVPTDNNNRQRPHDTRLTLQSPKRKGHAVSQRNASSKRICLPISSQQGPEQAH